MFFLLKVKFLFFSKKKKNTIRCWQLDHFWTCLSQPSCCWRCCCLFFSFSFCVVLLNLMIWPQTCASAAFVFGWRTSFSLTFHFVHSTSWTVVGLICVKMINFILYNAEHLCEHRSESIFHQDVRYRFIKSTEWSLTLQRTACVFTLLVLRDQRLAALYMEQDRTRCHCN